MALDLVKEVSDQVGGYMPSASQLRAYDFGNALAGRISRMGGVDAVASMAGLPQRDHCSRRGWRWERWFASLCRGHGLSVIDRGRVKAPYDMTVNGATVEVKSAEFNVYGKKGDVRGWGFNIHNQTRADILAVICLRDEKPDRLYLIPGGEPKSTLTICDGRRGKWERYIVPDHWFR